MMSISIAGANTDWRINTPKQKHNTHMPQSARNKSIPTSTTNPIA